MAVAPAHVGRARDGGGNAARDGRAGRRHAGPHGRAVAALSPSPPSPRAADTARAAATRGRRSPSRGSGRRRRRRLQAAARVQRARFDADELRRRQWLEYHARSGRRDDALAHAVTPEEV